MLNDEPNPALNDEPNRFDLEQKIMFCWQVVDHLKASEDEYIKAVALVYEKQFDELFRMFEEMVSKGKIL
jgi:pentatricopeptide repeat protein